jgi:hypothetical protein
MGTLQLQTGNRNLLLAFYLCVILAFSSSLASTCFFKGAMRVCDTNTTPQAHACAFFHRKSPVLEKKYAVLQIQRFQSKQHVKGR